MASRWRAVRPRQSASTKRMASASVASTPASMAWALEPSPTRVTTFAPAAAATSPVASSEESSTTMTSRTCSQPRHAATTAATVVSSLRAGTTASMGTCQRKGSAGTAAQPRPLAPAHDLDGHLARRLVDHLVAEHHRALALAFGRRLLVCVEDVVGPVELLLRRREHLVEDRDLIGVQGPFAVVAQDLGAAAEVAETLGVAHAHV